MIGLDNACRIAYDYFGDVHTRKGIEKIYESEKRWIFFGKSQEDNATEYGNTPISIEKETGNGILFSLADEDNYKILETAKVIEVPRQYCL